MAFWEQQYPFLLLPRAKLGVWRAIKQRKIFHVLSHPYTFVLCPSLKQKLDGLLAFVASKRDKGQLEVMTMGDIASLAAARRAAIDRDS
jgi:hypothetical protein